MSINAGLVVRNSVTVSESQFKTPVHSPYGETASLANKEAMEWSHGPDGLLYQAQHMQQRIERSPEPVVQDRPGDGFVGPGGKVYVAVDRHEQGRVIQGDGTLFFSQSSSGYEGDIKPTHRFEVHHQSRGVVTILEYDQGHN